MSVIEIVPITQGHIEGFHKTLDVVARERRYLSFLEAPPFESTRAFILDMIEQRYQAFLEQWQPMLHPSQPPAFADRLV